MTELIIAESSKILSKIENLEPRLGQTATPNLDFPFPLDSRPSYEIFNNLENLIVYADDDDTEFFMPVLEGK